MCHNGEEMLQENTTYVLDGSIKIRDARLIYPIRKYKSVASNVGTHESQRDGSIE